jgi:hypothetical protein
MVSCYIAILQTANASMLHATEMCSAAPHQIERVDNATVPSANPAMIDAKISAGGLRKWIMQYGTIITAIE